MRSSVTLGQKMKGALQLFRPELPLAAGLCVVIGQVVALGSLPALSLVGLGFGCGFLLSASALITNDYFDLEVDRINAPQRPLPSGLLTPFEVMALGLATALLGLGAAWILGAVAFGVSVLIWLLGFAYNAKFKATGLWGNLMVSTSVGSTFLLGGISVGQMWHPAIWVLAGITFCFDLAEEIAGDAMDAEGDQSLGSRSIALVYGRATALRVAAMLFGVVVVVTLLVVVLGNLLLQQVLTILVTNLLIIFFVVRLLRSQTPAEGRQAMRGLYLSGSLGLFVFLLAMVFV
ncbi:UbiA family prenyltransferase [Candidatus Chloroploca asiatica]|uniref:Prenyltransferase n=1 Tax=Candidatus Chloroploca asiatica TaxID=1506545 RepID=A0A2H3KLW9_9CHLR|nr:UbiA family prenyltransferase [Candidatus Chloroploca asiatica]PDV99091.1 prenyltransferase [Candidatus Chloroploca asiatica]